MMTITEKVAYLKGLADGINLDESTKEGKMLIAMLDVIDDMALSIADMEDSMTEMSQQVDEIDDDLAAIEEDWYEDYDDEDCDSEVVYEVECPTCGDIICIDEDMAEEGKIACPNCAENLEFDFSEVEDCGCGCGDDCDCDDCDCSEK